MTRDHLFWSPLCPGATQITFTSPDFTFINQQSFIHLRLCIFCKSPPLPLGMVQFFFDSWWACICSRSAAATAAVSTLDKIGTASQLVTP